MIRPVPLIHHKNIQFSINTSNEQKVIPEEYHLYQNSPNPFNPATTIKFDLPKDGIVELSIYDILGRKITTLINEYRSAGSYEQSFNASSLASGIYLYRIKVNDFVSAKKMILAK
ncbi:MAG: T9SS type A sorting domain-containing protein [Ignavibacterium sp.]|nr:T9SS type A sorting domain-containing protein [Ignavibacterium sp.]